MTMSLQTYIAEGFMEDCEQLIHRLTENYQQVDWHKFCYFWKEMQFDILFYGRQSGPEVVEFTEEVLQTARLYMVTETDNFEDQVVGVFIAYAITIIQPYKNLCALRLVPKDVQSLKKIEAKVRMDGRRDVLMILGKLYIYGNIQCHVSLRERAMDITIRKYFDGSTNVPQCISRRWHGRLDRHGVYSLEDLAQMESNYIDLKLQAKLAAEAAFPGTIVKVDMLKPEAKRMAESLRKLISDVPEEIINKEEETHDVISLKQKAMKNVVDPMRHLHGLDERKKDKETKPRPAAKTKPRNHCRKLSPELKPQKPEKKPLRGLSLPDLNDDPDDPDDQIDRRREGSPEEAFRGFTTHEIQLNNTNIHPEPSTSKSLGMIDLEPYTSKSLGMIDLEPSTSKSLGMIDLAPSTSKSLGMIDLAPSTSKSLGMIDLEPSTSKSLGMIDPEPSTSKSRGMIDLVPSTSKSLGMIDLEPSTSKSLSMIDPEPSTTKSLGMIDPEPSTSKSLGMIDLEPSTSKSLGMIDLEPSTSKSLGMIDLEPSTSKSLGMIDLEPSSSNGQTKGIVKSSLVNPADKTGSKLKAGKIIKTNKKRSPKKNGLKRKNIKDQEPNTKKRKLKDKFSKKLNENKDNSDNSDEPEIIKKARRLNNMINTEACKGKELTIQTKGLVKHFVEFELNDIVIRTEKDAPQDIEIEYIDNYTGTNDLYETVCEVSDDEESKKGMEKVNTNDQKEPINDANSQSDEVQVVIQECDEFGKEIHNDDDNMEVFQIISEEKSEIHSLVNKTVKSAKNKTWSVIERKSEDISNSSDGEEVDEAFKKILSKEDTANRNIERRRLKQPNLRSKLKKMGILTLANFEDDSN